MHRSLFFSAARSEAFERARRESEEHAERAQQTLLWKRGFHINGNHASWGYYLETATPPTPPSTTDGGGGSESGEDEGGDGEEQETEDQRDEDTGSAGAASRGASTPDSPTRGITRLMPFYGNGSLSRRRHSAPALTRPAARRLARAAARRASMAVKTHTFVSVWFALTVPVIFWDAAYCFLRPRSMVGGDLHWIWTPYALYQEVDYVYGVKALQNGDGFTNAQSALNIVENFMNIAYLYLAHVAGSPAAPLVGFASAVMTLSKTVLYWLQEYYCGGCAVGHNDLKTLIVYWIIPNGLWLIVPSLIIWQLAKDITGSLRVANRAAVKAASGKRQ